MNDFEFTYALEVISEGNRCVIMIDCERSCPNGIVLVMNVRNTSSPGVVTKSTIADVYMIVSTYTRSCV